jgi:hypothetical protein
MISDIKSFPHDYMQLLEKTLEMEGLVERNPWKLSVFVT